MGAAPQNTLYDHNRNILAWLVQQTNMKREAILPGENK